MASRQVARRKLFKAAAANDLSNGELRRCYVCGAVKPWYRMVSRVKALWSCGEGNHKPKEG